MLTERELISKLQKLNDIKPRQDWVILTKREILNPKSETNNSIFQFLNFSIFKSNFLFQRKFAYAFSTSIVVILGTVGFAQYAGYGDMFSSAKKIAEQSEAALSQLAQIQIQNAETKEIKQIKQSTSRIAKILKNNSVRNSQSAKELADEVQKIKQLKTLADLSGTPEMKNLDDALESLVKSEINDLDKATLTEEQQKKIKEIKDLYDKQDYTTALEKILTF